MKSFYSKITLTLLCFVLTISTKAQVFDYVNTGLSNPVGFTIDNGTMYIGSIGTSKIQTVDMTDPNLVPQDFIDNISFPTDFIVIGTDLYFTYGLSTVGKIDLTATTPMVTNVISGLSNAFSLAVKDDYIYVSLRNSGEIIRFDYTLGINPPTELVSNNLGSFLNQVLIDNDYLYVTRGSDQKVSRVDLSLPGFPVEDIVTLTPEDDSVIGIGINNGKLFYSSSYLKSVDLNNLANPPITYFSGISSPLWEILFDNNEMYLSQQTDQRIVRFEDNFIDPTTSPDYGILLNFYNSNNGVNWNNSNNWLSTGQSLYSWHGIETENNRVIGLNSNSNNVNGVLQSDFGNLDQLRTLNISFSDLSGLPSEIINLNNIESIQLTNNMISGVLPDFSNLPLLNRLSVGANNYLFGDLETNFLANQNITDFFYSPQAKLSDDVSQFVSIGQNLSLDATTTGANNLYQWFYDDQPMANETNPVLNLTNIQQSQFGDYRCEVTNSLVTNLTLETGVFTVGLDPTASPDYNALVAFYNSTNGDNWTTNTNWLDPTKPLSTWHGVTTQIVNNEVRVTQIILESNNLDGNMPPELGDFTFLQLLNLQVNNITGAIPDEIGNLNNLTFLRLNTNAITGDFPIPLTTLSQVQFLSLSVNQMTGVIPPEIGNMTSLQQLYFGGSFNSTLTPGIIPPEIGNLTNLIVLDLRGSNLIGNIPPEMGNLTNLQFLTLFLNDLEGSIPSSIGSIPFLLRFDVQLNSLSGDIPYFNYIGSSNPTNSVLNIANNNFQFGDFETEHNIYLNNSNLTYLFSPQNNLPAPDNIVVGIGEAVNIPFSVSGTQNNYTWFKQNQDGSITNVDFDSTLDLTINSISDYGVYGLNVTSNIVPGLIISSDTFVIEGLPTDSPDYNALVALYNSTNGVNWTNNDNWLDTTQPLSSWIGLSADPATNRVTSISLSNNNITGTLPQEIGDFSELKTLAFQNNSLNGEIPIELWNLTNLEQIFLNDTSIDGSSNLTFTNTTGPTFSNLPNLINIFMSDMDIPQQAVTDISSLNNLNILYLIRCGLGPNLPASWSSIAAFGLQLSGNDFTGSIPVSYQNDNISFLDISNNLYDFSDLEPVASSNSINSFSYSPQRTQDEALTIQEPPGSDIILNIDDTDVNSENLVSSANNNVYQWFKDGISILGATANTYTILNAQVNDSGIYTCEITNTLLPDLIIEREPITVEIDETFSVLDRNLNEITIYPNPVRNWLNIKTSFPESGTIFIYDLTGKLVKQHSLDVDFLSLNIENLSEGQYILNFKSKTQSITKKLIKI